MEIPSFHAAAAIALAIAAFWLFARGSVRIEFVSLGLIAILALLLYFFPVEREGSRGGIEIAFSGFSHEALIAICCLMILGRGLVVTGALEPAARTLTRIWRYNRVLGLLLTLVAAAGLSMVVNDTPVLVLLLPLLLNLSARIGLSASKTLMPVNCAILIGGMATTIGTSTNLLVVSIAEDLGLPSMSVFEFTGIALVAALVALPYLLFVMPRLLPENAGPDQLGKRRFQAVLYDGNVGSRGASWQDVSAQLQLHSVKLIGMPGNAGPDHVAGGTARNTVLVEGDADHLREAALALKATLVPQHLLEGLQNDRWKGQDDLIIAQLAVAADSQLVGETIKSAEISDRHGVAVIGFNRPEAEGHMADPHALTDMRIRMGDVLLIQGKSEDLHRFEIEQGAMMLAGASEIPRSAKAPLAAVIFALSVAAAATHLLPIAISSMAGAIAMLATGCVKFERVGRALSAEVIVLVAASIALGRALLETGAAEWLGVLLSLGLQFLPAGGVLAAMMTFSAILTNFSSNTAAAAVGTPIAFSLAERLDIAAQPLVLAVLFGCNLCFATPVAYQTNILIMGPGGYAFRDYVRAGLPLAILMIGTLSLLLVWQFGL